MACKLFSTTDKIAQIGTYTNPVLPLHPKLTETILQFLGKIK